MSDYLVSTIFVHVRCGVLIRMLRIICFVVSCSWLRMSKHLVSIIFLCVGYRIAQNVGGGKHWRIWQLSIDSPKFSHPKIVDTLKYNGKLTQFAKVLPSKYVSRLKFHSANILRYTLVSCVN